MYGRELFTPQQRIYRGQQMVTTFRVTGAVCGSCSHKHVSVVGAAQCACRYERVCDEAGSYSDRRLVAMNDGVICEATGNEYHEFAHAYEVAKALWALKHAAPYRAHL